MNFYLIPAFGMLAFIAGGCATSIDMGTCSCVCGGSGSVISSSEPATYYDRIRGPKGALGNPGKPGPQGPPGSIGKLGPRGEPGRSFGGSGSRATPAESCFDLRVGGKTTSGIYTIQPTEFSAPIEVYCDLKSAGGGWTLVASIHENNIYGKCTAGDKWSSEQGKTSENYRGTGSWENYEIFGNPESATSADYKSPAYFSLPGSNVMIWHVPNNVDIQEAYTEADLKYYTDTGFLAEYGGTLQSLFSKHYPLTIASRPGATMEGVTSLISALNQSASTIRAFIPDFYQYVYDFDGPVQNYIKDGGQDMFDTGNKLYYQIGDAPPTLVTYNKNYRNRTQGVDLLAATSHPFNALMWVGNPAGVTQSFRLKVTSGTGADGDGSSRTMSGAMTLGNFSLSYHAYNVYSASDPSICEVFYYVSNPVVWSSVPPTSFEKSPWTSGTDTLSHGVVASGSPQSFLMGYTLLSRASDSEVAEYDIRRILNKTLSVISNFGKIDEFNCSRIGESLVQPIVYLSGNNDKVLNKIPPLAKAQVTPGFLQFRAYSPRGIPNAICPAVKSEACKPESVCLGGINTMSIDSSSCGDFAGWGGSAADTPTKTQPSGAARALDDINSSILIFTRKQA